MRVRLPVRVRADDARSVRRRTSSGVCAVLLGVAVMVAVAACGSTDPASGKRPSGKFGEVAGAGSTAEKPAQPGTAARPPARAAGGACKLLDYTQVKTAVGTDFHVAVARSRGDTQSCVLQVLNTAYPDLILTLAPTRADATVFQTAVVPKGAQKVTQLGKAAYSTVVEPDGGAGAAVEVGWLGDGGRILTVRYTHQPGVKSTAASKKTAAVVALARKLEAAR